MEKHVYFVRHGESDSNKDGIIRGEHAALTDRGKEEADVVATRLKRIGVTALISSPYSRTIATAQPASGLLQLPIAESDLFVEWRRPSVMVGQSWRSQEFKALQDSVIEGYAQDDGFRHSDEENFTDFKKRAEQALEFLVSHPSERIAVISHGIFIRALLGVMLFGGSFSGIQFQRLFYHTRVNNTGITYCRYEEGIWRLISWNDSAHLG